MMAAVKLNPCIDVLYGWPRRYTYWGGKTWLTGKLLATREDVERLIRRREPMGVWQCYAEGGNDCAYRDVVVFEFDAKGCDSLQCILEQYGEELRRVAKILSQYKPLTWWNGNKSIYWAVPIRPVDASYVPRPEWVELVKAAGMDVSMLTPKHSFRLPCTPHQATGRFSTWLDPSTLKPVKTPQLRGERESPFTFLEPPPPPKPRRVEPRTGGAKSGSFNVLEAVRELVESSPKLQHDCRKRLAAFIGGMCAALGKAVEECLEYMRSLPVEWAKEHERFMAYYYGRVKEGKSKFSFKSLVEGGRWYSITDCL